MSYYEKLMNKFGNPLHNHIEFEREWMVLYALPIPLSMQLKNFPHRIYINRYCQPALEEVLCKLAIENLLNEIQTFDGCYSVRKQRNSDLPSIHSWGLALDFNSNNNPFGYTREEALGKKLKPFSKGFIEVWRNCGWICGADFKKPRTDAMHFEFTKEFMS